MSNKTVTSIVHHHIKENEMEHFHLWLKKVRGECSKYVGYIDSKIIDNCGHKNEIISIFRFENQQSLKAWLDSSIHQNLLDELQSIVEQETKIKSYTGLEFWFERTPQKRLKMSVLTFIGLLPLVLIIPPALESLTGMGFYGVNIFSTIIIVLLMTYLVMPIIMNIHQALIQKLTK